MNYRLSPSAEKDLFDIWEYTFATWGGAQAEKYLQILDSRFINLAEEPQRGKLREDILSDYYSFHEGRHVIFYTMHGNGIAIARILHERMDLVSHLKKDSGDF